jgi:hypothetical protein
MTQPAYECVEWRPIKKTNRDEEDEMDEEDKRLF